MSHYATLSVDLAALRANYNLLKNRHAKKNSAAVVKANAYGLGVAAVSKALAAEGCKLFFVATIDEAIELRSVLPDVEIAVFNGIFKGEEKEYVAHNIIPIVNDPGQLALCGNHQEISNRQIIIHFDSGMTRLGLSLADMENCKLPLANCKMLMSHLSCAAEQDNPENLRQLVRLREVLKYFPNIPVSFANSSGLFLADEFHFDIGRPGCALYGINPLNSANPMRHVATLSAPILQIRQLDRNEHIGYGASYAINKGGAVAIVGLGYADGYFRSLGNRGFAFLEGNKVPIAGRISMDMIALDISGIAAEKISAESRAEFINEQQTVDEIARQCDTIGYEIFTRIGGRVIRCQMSDVGCRIY